jgi:type I restriction enzyme S subunit
MSDDIMPESWVSTAIEDCLLSYSNNKKIRQGWSPQCESYPAKTLSSWGVLKTTSIQDGYFVDYENKHLPSHLEPRTHLEVTINPRNI